MGFFILIVIVLALLFANHLRELGIEQERHEADTIRGQSDASAESYEGMTKPQS